MFCVLPARGQQEAAPLDLSPPPAAEQEEAEPDLPPPPALEEAAPRAGAAGAPGGKAVIEFLDLSQMEITEVLKIIGDTGNWSIIPGKEVQGPVSVYLRNIGAEDALERVLSANGYRFVRDGETITVMTDAEYDLNVGPATEQRTYRLQFAEAARITPMIQGALSTKGRAVPDTSNNQLVVFDMPNRFPEVERLIATLDRKESTRVIPLKYATVSELRPAIEALMSDPRNLHIDERTNRLIVTDTPSRLDHLEEVIGQLDLEDLTETRTYVLKNADVEGMAALVAEVIGGAEEAQTGSGAGDTSFESSGSDVTVSDPVVDALAEQEAKSENDAELARLQRMESRSIVPGEERGEEFGLRAQLGAPEDGAPPSSFGGSSGESAHGQVTLARALGVQGTVIADPRTNSIIVTHTPAVLNRLETIIEALDRETAFHTYQFQNADLATLELDDRLGPLLKGSGESYSFDTNTGKVIFHAPEQRAVQINEFLKSWDVAPRQVQIEARILRVSLDLVRKLGVTLRYADLNTDGSVDTIIDLLFPPTEVGEDAVPQGLIHFGSLDNGKLSAIIQAIETEGMGNLLSNPRLAVLDRRLAKFQVAVDQPFVEVVTDANSDVTRESTRFIPVGVILEVLPVITESGGVKMEVRVEVSSLLGRSTDGAPIVDRSEASSVVLVQDGRTLVIGGLIVDEEIETVNKVPWLGDIPGLQHLFRNKVLDKQKSELVLFLTPRITGDGEPAPAPEQLALPDAR